MDYRSELIRLSVQHTLSDADRLTVARIFQALGDVPKGEYKTDCMELITKRLWNM